MRAVALCVLFLGVGGCLQEMLVITEGGLESGGTMMMIGSFALILLITLLSAVLALTLGILMSTLANNEFQMIQFIPLIIVPQIFFSGLFDLPAGIEVVGYVMPLYYIADALTEVMIRGNGFAVIAWDLGIIFACSVLFMTLNTLLLKKYRRV